MNKWWCQVNFGMGVHHEYVVDASSEEAAYYFATALFPLAMDIDVELYEEEEEQ